MNGKTTACTGGSQGSGFLTFFLCLCVVLIALFHRSFRPEQVVFANDGPLGAVTQQSLRLPSAFTGVWYDLNGFGASGGTSAPNLTQGLLWLLGPLCFAKFFAPIAMLMVGLSAWFLFRQLKLARLACVLGGLAAAFNSDFFSTACWGVASQPIAFAPVIWRWGR